MFNIHTHFENFAGKVINLTGSTWGFISAGAFMIVWFICRALFHFSDNWLVYITSMTTVVTFLMVFIIQKSQNKELLAIQLKLNELIAAESRASNRVLNVENLGDEEMKILKDFYNKLSEMSKKDKDLLRSRTIEEAILLHK